MTERKCQKCGNHVPAHVWVDGKRRNCQRRKYCFKCSPFGEHNTRKLENVEKGLKTCPDCKEQHSQKGNRCFRCYFQKRQKEVSKKIQGIVGRDCWICGYNRCQRSVGFHHVDPKTKLFGLTTREMMLKWSKVYAEMKKCIRVCANCHGEIHDGLISDKKIRSIWKKEWNARNT